MIKVLNVADFGAVGDGGSHPLSHYYSSLAAAQVDYPHAQSLDDEIDWAAIQKAVNQFDRDDGGLLRVYGHFLTNRKIHVDHIRSLTIEGVGQAFQTGVPYAGSRIIKTAQIPEPVLLGSAAGRLQLRDLGLEHGAAPSAGMNGLELDNSDAEFSRNCVVSRVSIRWCWNGVFLNGGATGSSFEDMHIHASGNDAFHSTGTFGVSRFQNIYCASAYRDGFHIYASASFFSGIVTEGIERDGFAGGFSRCTMAAMYIGDRTGRYGFNWVNSSENHVLTGNFVGQKASAIFLDSSHSNQFDYLAIEGLAGDYFVEVANTQGLSDSVLNSPNVVWRIRTNTGPRKALTNATGSRVIFQNVAVNSSDMFTQAFSHSQVAGDRWSWVSRTINPNEYALIDDGGPGSTNPSERWSFYSHLPGGRQQTGVFAFMGRQKTNMIGVLQSSEVLDTNIVSGDSSTFTNGTGSWVATNGALVSSAGAGVFTANGAATGRILLRVEPVSSKKLYRLTFRVKLGDSASGIFNAYVRSGSGVGEDLIRISPSNSTANLDATQMAYLIPDSDAIEIILSIANPVNGDNFTVDDVELREVRSEGSMGMTGGWKFGREPGGGGSVICYANEWTGKAGSVEIDGLVGVNETPIVLTVNAAGVISAKRVYLGDPDSAGAGHRQLRVVN